MRELWYVLCVAITTTIVAFAIENILIKIIVRRDK